MARRKWLYLVTAIDLFSRKVVGYAQGEHMRPRLCVEALESPARQRGRHPGLIPHSVRGVQFIGGA